MSNGDTHEMAIPDDLKADYRTLAEPYVEPATLQWAIERDKNMQKFAHKLIERIAQLTQELNGIKLDAAYVNCKLTVDAQTEIIASLKHRNEELQSALLQLAHAVFGVEGSEPDVYQDYDKLCELERIVEGALLAAQRRKGN